MTLLGCLLIIIFLISYEKRKNSKISREASEKFWDRESRANLTMRKDLSSLNFVDVPFSQLPFDSNASGELLEVQKKIEHLQEEKFVNLAGYTNTDLKLAYGRGNLELLTTYDQNFTLLTRTLHKWGMLLYETERYSEAECIFQISIDCGTDICGTYTQLALIYTKTGRPGEIESLITAAEKIRTVMKDATLQKLRQILSTAYAS